MPANRGLSGNEWHPKPDFPQRLRLGGPEVPSEAYVAQNLDDCARYIASLDLPELDVYDNESGVRDQLTLDMAQQVFTPGKPVLEAIMAHRAMQDGLVRQDQEHERLLAFRRVERDLAARLPSNVIAAEHRFMAVSLLTADGVLHTEVTTRADSSTAG
jgi:hypothetical protein